MLISANRIQLLNAAFVLVPSLTDYEILRPKALFAVWLSVKERPLFGYSSPLFECFWVRCNTLQNLRGNNSASSGTQGRAGGILCGNEYCTNFKQDFSCSLHHILGINELLAMQKTIYLGVCSSNTGSAYPKPLCCNIRAVEEASGGSDEMWPELKSRGG